jgi:hypothetical protein
MHGAPAGRIGLWLPVNIRERAAAGFGNGTSRIRVHSGGDIGAQIRLGLRCGEWAVPARPMVTRLPRRIGDPIMRWYLNRPWADMGSIVFSCIENWRGRHDPVFQNIEQIDIVGQLHRRHPLAINAIAHDGRTCVTFTYDPQRLTSADAGAFADLYRDGILRAGSAAA